MPETAKRTFDLPLEQASYIDSLVESGAYASQDEVVLAGLEALQDRDEGIDRWLREEVAPAYDAAQADRTRIIPADQVLAEIEARHVQRLKADGV